MFFFEFFMSHYIDLDIRKTQIKHYRSGRRRRFTPLLDDGLYIAREKCKGEPCLISVRKNT
jgi:hypothetical protein